MKGFFDPNRFKPAEKGSRKTCYTCGLYRTCKTPKMEPGGTGKYPILICGEAPGKNEDEQETQFVGKAGKYFDRIFRQEIKISIHDCKKTNTLICRPPDNKTPKPDQVVACRPNLIKTIKEFKPKLIFLVGKPAVDAYFGDRIKKLYPITTMRQCIIPDHDYGCWVKPIFHPSYVGRELNKKNRVIEVLFKQDICKAFSYLDKPLPEPTDQNKVKILKDQRQITRYLKRILQAQPSLLAFDYETTGLKPDMEGHKIHCVSTCWSKDLAISFSCLDWNPENKRLFLRIMSDEMIGKTAQNMKFEDKWTNKIFGIKVKNWAFDTMVYAHIENNTAPTGLKFQAQMQLGLWDYDSHLSKFLTGHGNKGSNNFNQVDKIPKDDLLLYCGIDSLVQWRLAERKFNA